MQAKSQRLCSLFLSSNELCGTLEGIPNPLYSFMYSIDVSNNSLAGHIPKSFFDLTRLQQLKLDSNHFQGTVELSLLWKLRSLYSLMFSNNMLSVKDVEDDYPFTYLDNIRTLGLASCSLTKIPIALRYTNELSYLDLSNNQIDGVIPSWIWMNWKDSIFFLDLSNNMFTCLENSPSIVHMHNLEYLNLSSNQLHGSVPIPLTARKSMVFLDYSNNNFSSITPDFGCMLQTIDLNNNLIEGEIPRSLSNCQGLELLDVGNNQIVGSFPSWFGILPHLRVLVLRSNQLNGTIRDIKHDQTINNYFASLQILDLASNNFSGNLPKGWFNELKAMMENVSDEGQVLGHETSSSAGFYQDTVTITFKGSDLSFIKILSTFNAIDISNNSFDGHVPESIGMLVSLRGLNMSYNNFTGQIPFQYRNLSQLEPMDLLEPDNRGNTTRVNLTYFS
uniref:Putative LRR receptor-like serine/threonine-protein kinase n=1 Tax=Aegilops tauschii TaxID=37682 RepID=N1QPS1_AEGTA